MRLSRVKIKNFRSIQELDIELPHVCALVGPNNVGKTNILEAIKRVLDRSWVRADDFSTDDIYLHDENRDIEIACRAGSACLNSFLRLISGAPARVKPPRHAAAR
jgi:putative ATP-dependent endonuclease of OLD family